MKNKRWKRKAKRLYGTCNNNFLCSNCNCLYECSKLHLIPIIVGLRGLENHYRGNKEKR